MKRFLKSKKGVALFATLVVAAVAAVAAYAYFTGNGTGTGSAQTATAASLQITQIGAGYDSLIPNGGYHQDQCFACAQITEFGNKIKLANPGTQRLTSAVVAFRNWGDGFNDVPITLSIVGGPSSTVTPVIAGKQANGRPTVTNVTFPFNDFVGQELLYKISFNPASPADGLNVALSSSPNTRSIGSESDPGHVWVNTTAGPGIANDFPACTTPGTGFAEVTTDCGPESSNNPGAYGTDAQVAAGNADIPAVEFNVVGGVAPALYPGGPAEPVDFQITNPGLASVHVGHVAIAVTGNSRSGVGCQDSWYAVAPASPGLALNATIPPGTTIEAPSGASISMTDTGTNQDACQGANVNLGFTATGS